MKRQLIAGPEQQPLLGRGEWSRGEHRQVADGLVAAHQRQPGRLGTTLDRPLPGGGVVVEKPPLDNARDGHVVPFGGGLNHQGLEFRPGEGPGGSHVGGHLGLLSLGQQRDHRVQM